MTKRLSQSEKNMRRPASRACIFCHSKHLQCLNERPCRNCVKRNLADKCLDVTRKRAKYLDTEALRLENHTGSSVSSNDGSPGVIKIEDDALGQSSSFLQTASDTPGGPGTTAVQPPTAVMLNTTNDVLNKLLFTDPSNTPDTLSATLVSNAPSKNTFNSNYLNQEYLMLGDIILHSKPLSPLPSNTSNSEYIPPSAPSPATILGPAFSGNMIHRKQHKLKDSRPFISLGFSDHQTHDEIPHPNVPARNMELESTNAPSLTQSGTEGFTIKNEIMNPHGKNAQKDYISPLISHHLYQTVQDIYSNSIMNFDYPNSYHLLTKFLKQRFLGNSLPVDEKQEKRKNLLIILKLVASYRPTFISAHGSLFKPLDLQFLEMSFQRSLIDYENLSQLNSSPTVIWRRTGEIVSISNDLISLLGFNVSDILSKRTFIMELMYDDESIVNYFKLFKSVAVGNLHLSIKTKCKLIKNHRGSTSTSPLTEEDDGPLSGNYIEFCSVWTVKRDLFDLPMLIVGQFLPILPTGEGFRMY